MHGCPHVEDEVHLLFKCQFAKRLWFTNLWGIRWQVHIDKDLNSYLDKIWNLESCFSVAKDDRDDFILYNVLIFLAHLVGEKLTSF